MIWLSNCSTLNVPDEDIFETHLTAKLDIRVFIEHTRDKLKRWNRRKTKKTTFSHILMSLRRLSLTAITGTQGIGIFFYSDTVIWLFLIFRRCSLKWHYAKASFDLNAKASQFYKGKFIIMWPYLNTIFDTIQKNKNKK